MLHLRCPTFGVPAMLLASVLSAGAHLGNENNTEVRVYSDSMRVVIRTSLPFAWTLLGDNAPALADETGQAVAKPLLTAAAADLITVTAAGKPLVPAKVDCVFEVEKDVAFVLTYERPAAWPVVLEARFFDRLTSLDTGTMSVFDYSASRFSRDLEPIATKVIDQRQPALSFTLEPPASPLPPARSAAPVPPATVLPDSPPFRKILAISILLLAAAAVGYLARKRLRADGGAP